MRISRSVVLAWGLAWRIGALAIGGSWLLAIPAGDWDRGGESLETIPALAGDSPVDTSEVTIQLARDGGSSFYSLRDKEGDELGRVTYGRESLVVQLAGFPARPGFSAQTDGSCRFAVSQEGIRYLLILRPGGRTGLLVSDDRRGLRDGLCVTPDGRILHGSSNVDWMEFGR
jgi:hypothetical protein